MATVIIASIVAIIFVAIIASEIHKKKTGKSSLRLLLRQL